ncbi:predicted protein [Botrytis cinerea T4]|uniref:Uncharacterized protein n=1 Tax=Botryotinia fuckeliana (strain T4) TaxID=999810 RepID=G2Y6K7_BOTF4|nr:predicted protein [Botrytis cinerea T4]
MTTSFRALCHGATLDQGLPRLKTLVLFRRCFAKRKLRWDTEYVVRALGINPK